jgi:3D (Asp-Asp-Asp) domain-containing protein
MENRRGKSSNRIVLQVVTGVCVVGFVASVAYTRTDRAASIRNSSLAGRSSAQSQDADAPSGEWRTVRMRVTGYCPCSKCCGDSADGITANGHRIQPGDTFVAADRRYAFGTEMVIPGYSSSEVVKVLDRGGAIRGDKLDAFFHTHQAALEWGVKYLDVQVRVN